MTVSVTATTIVVIILDPEMHWKPLPILLFIQLY